MVGTTLARADYSRTSKHSCERVRRFAQHLQKPCMLDDLGARFAQHLQKPCMLNDLRARFAQYLQKPCMLNDLRARFAKIFCFLEEILHNPDSPSDLSVI